MSNKPATSPAKSLEVIEKMDAEVLSVIGNGELQGFEKAFKVSTAIGVLTSLLTPEYMAPIMNLQGNRLGFRTDQDNNNGYPEPVVKNCLIEAVLMGVQPVGNQFNIIAGNTYITKEGFGYLLKKIPGLNYKLVPDLPRINNANTSAAIVVNIYWTLNGSEEKHQALEIPIRVNARMGTDAIIGKATRKARAWLFERITGNEVSDGDIADLDRLPAPKTAKSLTQGEQEEADREEEIKRALHFIMTTDSLRKLKNAKEFAEEVGGELLEAYQEREKELSK